MTLFSKKSNADRLAELKRRLAKYPQPFYVHRFVDKLEVLDGNGSDCTINLMTSVEDALNLIGKCEYVPEGEEIA